MDHLKNGSPSLWMQTPIDDPFVEVRLYKKNAKKVTRVTRFFASQKRTFEDGTQPSKSKMQSPKPLKTSQWHPLARNTQSIHVSKQSSLLKSDTHKFGFKGVNEDIVLVSKHLERKEANLVTDTMCIKLYIPNKSCFKILRLHLTPRDWLAPTLYNTTKDVS